MLKLPVFKRWLSLSRVRGASAKPTQLPELDHLHSHHLLESLEARLLMSVTIDAGNYATIYDAAQAGFSQANAAGESHIIVELEAGATYDEDRQIGVGSGKLFELRVDGPGDFARVDVDANAISAAAHSTWIVADANGGEISVEGIDAYFYNDNNQQSRSFIGVLSEGDLTVVNSRFSRASSPIGKLTVNLNNDANRYSANPQFAGDVYLDGVILRDSYQQNRPQGLYVQWAENITIKNSVIHNNGYHNYSNGVFSGTSVFDQGAYLDSENAYGQGYIENTIFSNNAHNGLQLRAGGVVTDSLFYRNPLGMFLTNGSVSDSAFFESTDLNSNNKRGRGLGINRGTTTLANDFDNRGHVEVRDNVFGWKLGTASWMGAIDYEGNPSGYIDTVEGNFVWDWPDEGLSSNYSGPGLTELASAPASLSSYANNLGVAAAIDAAVNRTRDEASSDGVNTARSIAAYYRAAANGQTPTIGQITLDSQSVDENQPVGTVVGSLDVVNDPSTTQTYSLTGGDVSAFSIDQATATLRTAQSFDYETQDSYSVQITATNANGDTVSDTFQISVANVAETPTSGAVTVTFDDYTGPLPAELASDTAYYTDNSGFRFRTVAHFDQYSDLFAVDTGSGDVGLRNSGWDQSLQLNRADGDAFKFEGFTFKPNNSAADLTLNITGYLDGVEVASQSLFVDRNSGQTVLNMDASWGNVDDVVIQQDKAFVIFDDFRFDESSAAPTTVTVGFDDYTGPLPAEIASDTAYYTDGSGFRFRTLANQAQYADLFAVDTGSGDVGLRNAGWQQSLETNRTDGNAFALEGLSFQPNNVFHDTTLTIRGYLDGTEVATQSMFVDRNSGQTVLDLSAAAGWGNVDNVTLAQNGSFLLFDDFRFGVTSATPAPTPVTADFSALAGSLGEIASDGAYYLDTTGFRFRTIATNDPQYADLDAVDTGGGNPGLRTEGWLQGLEVNQSSGNAFGIEGLSYQPNNNSYDTNLDLKGYLNGVQVASQSVFVDRNSGQTVLNLSPAAGWGEIDNLTITQNNAFVIFDDFRFLV